MKNVHTNIAVLQQFLHAEKPLWLTPVGRVIIEELLLASTGEMTCRLSITTLAERCNVSYNTVERSLKPLVEMRWIVKQSGKQYQETNTYAVQISSLPLTHELIRTVISLDAERIVEGYTIAVKMLPKVPSKTNPDRKRSAYRAQKGHEQRWRIKVQGWLDEGYTVEEIVQILHSAFEHTAKQAAYGIHCLRFEKLRTLCGIPKAVQQ